MTYEQIKAVENRINAELANLGAASVSDRGVQALLDRMVPEGWEWVEVIALGGPVAIAFTRVG